MVQKTKIHLLQVLVGVSLFAQAGNLYGQATQPAVAAGQSSHHIEAAPIQIMALPPSEEEYQDEFALARDASPALAAARVQLDQQTAHLESLHRKIQDLINNAQFGEDHGEGQALKAAKIEFAKLLQQIELTQQLIRSEQVVDQDRKVQNLSAGTTMTEAEVNLSKLP